MHKLIDCGVLQALHCRPCFEKQYYFTFLGSTIIKQALLYTRSEKHHFLLLLLLLLLHTQIPTFPRGKKVDGIKTEKCKKRA